MSDDREPPESRHTYITIKGDVGKLAMGDMTNGDGGRLNESELLEVEAALEASLKAIGRAKYWNRYVAIAVVSLVSFVVFLRLFGLGPLGTYGVIFWALLGFILPNWLLMRHQHRLNMEALQLDAELSAVRVELTLRGRVGARGGSGTPG